MHISGEETGGRSRCWRAGDEQAAGVTVKLAGAVRLVGVSRSAPAEGYDKNTTRAALGVVERSVVWHKIGCRFEPKLQPNLNQNHNRGCKTISLGTT